MVRLPLTLRLSVIFRRREELPAEMRASLSNAWLTATSSNSERDWQMDRIVEESYMEPATEPGFPASLCLGQDVDADGADLLKAEFPIQVASILAGDQDDALVVLRFCVTA